MQTRPFRSFAVAGSSLLCLHAIACINIPQTPPGEMIRETRDVDAAAAPDEPVDEPKDTPAEDDTRVDAGRGGSTETRPDARVEPEPEEKPHDPGAPSAVYPAPHPPPPILVNRGGPLMKAMKIVPVFFPNDAFQTDLVLFSQTVGETAYWRAATEEYGIGPATALAPVRVTTTPLGRLSDADVQAFVKANAGHTAGWGTPDANTIYVLYYPEATTITLEGVTSCEEFGGYHSHVRVDSGVDVAYAVIPRCVGGNQLGGLDLVTGATSHELIEAATDPLWDTEPGYVLADADLAWGYVLGGAEVSDLCAQSSGSFYKPLGYGYVVQRSWSNVLARGGHDPCAPALVGEPYFNAAPVVTDDIPVNESGMAKGVIIQVGESKTIEIDLFSDAPTPGPWSVAAYDIDRLMTGNKTLELVFDRDYGVNGEKLYLTIRVLARGRVGAEGILLVSSQGGRDHVWPVLVAN